MVFYPANKDTDPAQMMKGEHRSQIYRALARIVKRHKHKKQRQLDKKIIAGDESIPSEVSKKDYEPVIYYQERT